MNDRDNPINGVIGIVLMVAWIQGFIMTFSASFLLGVLTFFVQVPYPLIAILYWITGIDLPKAIVNAS